MTILHRIPFYAAILLVLILSACTAGPVGVSEYQNCLQCGLEVE